MQIIEQMLQSAMSIMNLPVTIWGFTLTLWKVFGFSVVSVILANLVWGVIDGD